MMMGIDRGFTHTGVETIVGHSSAPKAWHLKHFESPLPMQCAIHKLNCNVSVHENKVEP